MKGMQDIATELTTPVLLLAMPQVLDPFFHHSVVLLIHHEEEGSFGLILNRPTGIHVHEILKGMEVPWQGRAEAVAYFGGPVQPQLGTVLFAPGAADTTEAASEVGAALSITQHIGDLSKLAEEPPEHFRLFLGYAGWGAGQLIEEILRNDWLTAPVHDELVFSSTPDEIWATALRSIGIDPAALPSWTPPGDNGEDTAN